MVYLLQRDPEALAENNQKVLKIAEKVFILGTPLWGLLVTVLTLYGNGTPAQLWVIADYNRIPYICKCCHIIYLKWYLL